MQTFPSTPRSTDIVKMFRMGIMIITLKIVLVAGTPIDSWDRVTVWGLITRNPRRKYVESFFYSTGALINRFPQSVYSKTLMCGNSGSWATSGGVSIKTTMRLSVTRRESDQLRRSLKGGNPWLWCPNTYYLPTGLVKRLVNSKITNKTVW